MNTPVHVAMKPTDGKSAYPSAQRVRLGIPGPIYRHDNKYSYNKSLNV